MATYDEMVRNIEYLRDKADCSYEEAMALLEKFDGNLMRALVELERQGKVKQPGAPKTASGASQEKPKQDAGKKAASFIERALRQRIVVESPEHKETIANLSAPYCAAAAIIAPHLLVPSVALMFIMGYRVKLGKRKAGTTAQDVENFVDKTVTNIKKTAESFAGTVRQATKPETEENDEGGEVTVE